MPSREELVRLDLMSKSDVDKLNTLVSEATDIGTLVGKSEELLALVAKAEKLLSLVDLDSDLLTIVINEPTDGQVLTYDSTAGKWKNAESSGGAGGNFVVTITSADNAFASDKTLAEINSAYAVGTIPVALMTITNLDESTYDLAMALQACNDTIAIFGALYWSSDSSRLIYGAVTVSSEGVVDFSEVSLTIS